VRRLELGLPDGVDSGRTYLLISFISTPHPSLTPPGSLPLRAPVVVTWPMLERINSFERGDDFGRLDLGTGDDGGRTSSLLARFLVFIPPFLACAALLTLSSCTDLAPGTRLASGHAEGLFALPSHSLVDPQSTACSNSCRAWTRRRSQPAQMLRSTRPLRRHSEASSSLPRSACPPPPRARRPLRPRRRRRSLRRHSIRARVRLRARP
jgi:hypothetical protein